MAPHNLHKCSHPSFHCDFAFTVWCLAGTWRVKCDSVTPALWTRRSTSRSLCSDSRLVMPAYYSTSILDWSPSSTINLNWLAVGCDFLTVDGNRWEQRLSVLQYGDWIVWRGLSLLSACQIRRTRLDTNQTTRISTFHYSLFLNRYLMPSLILTWKWLLYKGIFCSAVVCTVPSVCFCPHPVKFMRIAG